MRLIVPVVLAIGLLAGCRSNSASVTFTPAALKDCGSHNVASTVQVQWDASAANPENGVKLWINNDEYPRRNGVFGGDPGTLWMAGAATGTATTGDWAFPGTTIIVTDAVNDDILATVKIPSAPCK